MDVAVKEPSAAYEYINPGPEGGGSQNPARLGTLEATQHPAVPGIMGDLIRQLGQETISNPNQGAAGPRQLATALETMHPESRAILAGEQAPALSDVMVGSRAYNYPTSQTGLNRATGGAADRNALAYTIATALGHLGGLPAFATAGIMPSITALRSAGLNSPATMNALRGGAPPPPLNFADLLAGANATNAALSQR